MFAFELAPLTIHGSAGLIYEWILSDQVTIKTLQELSKPASTEIPEGDDDQTLLVQVPATRAVA